MVLLNEIYPKWNNVPHFWVILMLSKNAIPEQTLADAKFFSAAEILLRTC